MSVTLTNTPVPNAPSQVTKFDFCLLDSPEFKEDSVREELIVPILKALGYTASGPNKIIRSKGLLHPYLTVGSAQRPITLIPDYLLTVGKNFTFVLDAKAPSEAIKTGKNVGQVYSYAIHPEVRVNLYALCNGREFILFDVRQTEPLLYFDMSEISYNWDRLLSYLTPVRTVVDLPDSLRTVRNNSGQVFQYRAVLSPIEVAEFQK